MILHKQVHIRGIYVGSRRDFEEMNEAITAATLKPVYQSHAWTEAQDVFRKMASATHFGKLVLRVA
jgi:D-arabinose 1-dehydrogenase-like Zn-dependent alcohol dehydrogenase